MPKNFHDKLKDTALAINNLPKNPPQLLIDDIKRTKKLFITGTPSQIFFPAPNIKYWSMRSGLSLDISFEMPAQAAKYYLLEHTVILLAASQTHPDVDRLAKRLHNINHKSLFAAVADPKSNIEKFVKKSFSLNLNHPVTDPPAVITQALFLKNTLALLQNRTIAPKLDQLSSQFQNTIQQPVKPQFIETVKNARNIFIVAENTGIGTELAFRTIQLLNKPAYHIEPSILENYLAHAVKTSDCLIFPNPSKNQLTPLLNLSQKDSPSAIAISEDPLPMENTICVPDIGELQDYIYLAAAWNLLAQTAD